MISRTSIFDNLRGYSMAINSVNNLETTDKADASKPPAKRWVYVCLLYTSDAADE